MKNKNSGANSKIKNAIQKNKQHNSVLKKMIQKQTQIREKEFEKHKNESLKISAFIGLFAWLICGVYTKQIIVSASVGILTGIVIFCGALFYPIMKTKKHSKKIEANLPFFLTTLVSELRVGKDFVRAIKNSCTEENETTKEYLRVVKDFEMGSSISEALKKMNSRIKSMNVKRVNSSLNNIYQYGNANKNDSLKRLTEELLLRQKIESKEFSGKMVVFALVFIAVSAIMPAMFQSFILIGSYFMSIKFTVIQVFLIIVLLFPTLDIFVLMMINSKTPLFLRN